VKRRGIGEKRVAAAERMVVLLKSAQFQKLHPQRRRDTFVIRNAPLHISEWGRASFIQ
jgi:hypothetical protein